MLGQSGTGKSLTGRCLFTLMSALMLLCFGAMQVEAAGDGRIVGKLFDSETGEPLVGAVVQLEGTSIGTQVDLDGSFVVRKVPFGVYTVVVKCVGYSKVRITGVEVSSVAARPLELALKPETVETGITVEVRAKAASDTEAALLKQRQNSTVVSDAISSQGIARSGSSNAAGALERVTGASIVEGRHVFVRGLGGRYANTRLNGSVLPSPDPDKQSLPMDLIPTSVLDNIVIEKSFAPDRPGDFAGGSIDLNTKKLTGSRFLRFSSSAAFHTGATFNEDFLTYQGGSKDWLAYDDGTRGVPGPISAPDAGIIRISDARRDRDAAYRLDAVMKSFSRTLFPERKAAPMDRSYSISYGDAYPVFETDIGVLAGLSYKRSYEFYDDGNIIHWDNQYNYEQWLHDTKGTDEVLWGGLVNLSLPVSPLHKLSTNYVYTRNAESTARYLHGPFPEQIGELEFEERVLRYLERSVGSLQFAGEHQLRPGVPLRADWQVSFSGTSQEDPDFRTLPTGRLELEKMDGGVDTLYNFAWGGSLGHSKRTYRELGEKKRDATVDFSTPLPFRLWDAQQGKFKFGTGFSIKTREHTERVFVLKSDIDLRGFEPQDFVSDSVWGLIDTSYSVRNPYRFGIYYEEDINARNRDYDSEQEVFSLYGMFELPITPWLSTVSGLRYERTRMFTENHATPKYKRSGSISEKDILPALSMVVKFTDDMNARLSYGKTLARPSMREFAPFFSQEYNSGHILNGNPELERTLIDNYDLRWEWFTRPGELVAFSLFRKDLKNPIERAVIDHNKNVKYLNVEDARVTGAELEARSQLDRIHRWLRNFQIGFNWTVMASRVALPASDYRGKVYRPLQGQSPYLLNLGLAYSSPNAGTAFNIVYNVFGKRLGDLSLRKIEHPYEQPRHIVDLTMSQKIWKGLSFNASAKNVLDARYKTVITDDGKEYVQEERSTGRVFSAGTTFDF